MKTDEGALVTRICFDVPEPDRLTMLITSLFMMPRVTPFDTSRPPDSFWTFRIETIGRPKVKVTVSPRTCVPGDRPIGQRESNY
ncbi:MAG: hypothetical protein OXF88_10380 [Rhodobacteraceae bacterium]|nr:hypothetical protein [Paracoccaceae bacterium]